MTFPFPLTPPFRFPDGFTDFLISASPGQFFRNLISSSNTEVGLGGGRNYVYLSKNL